MRKASRNRCRKSRAILRKRRRKPRKCREIEEETEEAPELVELEETPEPKDYEAVCAQIYPVLKAQDYFAEAATEGLARLSWLGDVQIAYVIHKGETNQLYCFGGALFSLFGVKSL